MVEEEGKDRHNPLQLEADCLALRAPLLSSSSTLDWRLVIVVRFVNGCSNRRTCFKDFIIWFRFRDFLGSNLILTSI